MGVELGRPPEQGRGPAGFSLQLLPLLGQSRVHQDTAAAVQPVEGMNSSPLQHPGISFYLCQLHQRPSRVVMWHGGLPASLLQIYHQHRHVRRRHPRHPAGLSQVLGADAVQLLPGLQPQALDGAVLQPLRERCALQPLHLLHLAELAADIAPGISR